MPCGVRLPCSIVVSDSFLHNQSPTGFGLIMAAQTWQLPVNEAAPSAMQKHVQLLKSCSSRIRCEANRKRK